MRVRWDEAKRQRVLAERDIGLEINKTGVWKL